MNGWRDVNIDVKEIVTRVIEQNFTQRSKSTSNFKNITNTRQIAMAFKECETQQII